MQLLFDEHATLRVANTRGRRNGAKPTDLANLNLVWRVLFAHRDSSAASLEHGASVSHVRQEEIALLTGLPLHEVIESITRLESLKRLGVERRSAGMSNRYTLYRANHREGNQLAKLDWPLDAHSGEPNGNV